MIKSAGHTDINNIDRDLVELLVAGIYRLERKHIIWLVGESENLREKGEKLELWLKFLAADDVHIAFYTSPFVDPYINNQGDLNSIGSKAGLIAGILDNKKSIVITTLSSMSIKLEPLCQLESFFLKIARQDQVNRDDLTKRLIHMGYRARNIVEDRGDIAWRGSIVDVFPINFENPVRIEIEASLVISLRLFDPETQKSVQQVDQVAVPQARFFLNFESPGHYFAHLGQGMNYLTDLLKDYTLVVSDRRKTKEEFGKLMAHYEKIYEIARNTGREKIDKVAKIFDFPFEKEKMLSINETHDHTTAAGELLRLRKSLAEFNYGDFGTIKDKIDNRGYKLFVFSSEKRIEDHLLDQFTGFNFINLKIPFSFENQKTLCLFLTDRSFRFFERFEKLDRPREARSERFVKEIKIYDLVVHRTHGIGRFIGFKRLEFEGNFSEFLKIEYLKREFLYVPVYELDTLSKYVSFEGYSPGLDKLGGSSWAAKQKRAQKSIVHFARELLDLYAVRKSIKGRTYFKDDELEDQLEGGFQYVETEDQKRTIRDVLRDLEAEFPMDRLVCGDVSFGKTEVAIRAAFRVISNGKQVAFLCPTTILVNQHFSTLKARFAPFPINIAMLSRMVPPAERKTIYQDLEAGRLDMVIGTHSLIARDIKFKNLGLYIVDEEQRFGVFQKEKLKQNRQDIDVLSLSATPIPRTLSLSLAGLQDISTIQTPPIGRLAIKNYVGYFSREIITSAVLNEMEREGLVFIVYNNIRRIFTFKDILQKWLPGIPITVIHAQMRNEEIEQNLMDFIARKYRLLLSTTIIENGIDIPEVNTLVVVDAHRFGLTQLYQLRGRIGRGSRQAYAYFLVESMNIPDKARSRLDAIREFADLGSGYKLAEFDLQLRGAGSLLGSRQHGHIEALGFDYYLDLLNLTVKELKGETEKQRETRVKINFSYSIDSGYIKDSMERIGFYKKILAAEEFDQIEELRQELNDRYGRMPDTIEKILFVGLIRVLVKKYRFEEVEVFLNRLVCTFSDAKEMEAILEKGFPEEISPEIIAENTLAFSFEDYHRFIDEIRKFCAV